jgi:hypothetical protein
MKFWLFIITIALTGTLGLSLCQTDVIKPIMQTCVNEYMGDLSAANADPCIILQDLMDCLETELKSNLAQADIEECVPFLKEALKIYDSTVNGCNVTFFGELLSEIEGPADCLDQLLKFSDTVVNCSTVLDFSDPAAFSCGTIQGLLNCVEIAMNDIHDECQMGMDTMIQDQFGQIPGLGACSLTFNGKPLGGGGVQCDPFSLMTTIQSTCLRDLHLSLLDFQTLISRKTDFNQLCGTLNTAYTGGYDLYGDYAQQCAQEILGPCSGDGSSTTSDMSQNVVIQLSYMFNMLHKMCKDFDDYRGNGLCRNGMSQQIDDGIKCFQDSGLMEIDNPFAAASSCPSVAILKKCLETKLKGCPAPLPILIPIAATEASEASGPPPVGGGTGGASGGGGTGGAPGEDTSEWNEGEQMSGQQFMDTTHILDMLFDHCNLQKLDLAEPTSAAVSTLKMSGWMLMTVVISYILL